MKIDKSAILDLLKSQGQDQKVAEADQQLPGEVDTERDSGLLQKLGIDPGDLVKAVTSGDLSSLKGSLGKFLGG